MKVQVQLFAAAKDAAGQALLSVALPAQATVNELRSALLQSAPGLQSLHESLLIAVNNQYAAGDLVLNETDEVACFPPVSGG